MLRFRRETKHFNVYILNVTVCILVILHIIYSRVADVDMAAENKRLKRQIRVSRN